MSIEDIEYLNDINHVEDAIIEHLRLPSLSHSCRNR